MIWIANSQNWLCYQHFRSILQQLQRQRQKPCTSTAYSHVAYINCVFCKIVEQSFFALLLHFALRRVYTNYMGLQWYRIIQLSCQVCCQNSTLARVCVRQRIVIRFRFAVLCFVLHSATSFVIFYCCFLITIESIWHSNAWTAIQRFYPCPIYRVAVVAVVTFFFVVNEWYLYLSHTLCELIKIIMEIIMFIVFH